MLLDSSAFREIYFIFQDSRAFCGWQLLKPGFRHVFAVEIHASGWVCYDPSIHDMYCWPLPCAPDASFIEHYKLNNPSDTVLKITARPKRKAQYARFSLMSCVSIMKYILGVRWPFVITPHQLYSRLTSQQFENMEIES